MIWIMFAGIVILLGLIWALCKISSQSDDDLDNWNR